MGEQPFQAASSGPLSQRTTSTSDSRGGLRITDSLCESLYLLYAYGVSSRLEACEPRR